MKGITNFDSSYPREKIIKYKIEPGSMRELEVRYLSSLYKKNYRIIDPIKVLVENPKTDKDDYIIEIEDDKGLLTYSHGRTLKKAIQRLRWLIIEMYEDLVKLDYDEMGPVLLDIKKFLKKHIEKYNS